MTNPCLPAALKLAAADIHVIPARSDIKGASYASARYSNGVPWGATNDPEVIKRYWAKLPDANLGIMTGILRKLIVVDVDGASHGVDGEASLNELFRRFGK